MNRRVLLAISLLSAALLASIALNCFLFRQGQGYYLQLNEVRLDPLGLSYYPTAPDQRSLTDPDRITVVFFGDSRAANWPAPDIDRFQFISRGIGAQTSAQAIRRFDDHAGPLRPQVVVVQVGINDLKTIPLFPERRESIVANCKENIRQIVTRSTDLGATVILSTIFPCGQVPLKRMPFWSDDVALAIDEVNAYIRSLEGENVIIFDAYAILADESGMTRTEYSEDLLHLNAAGYEALNEEFVLTLEEYHD